MISTEYLSIEDLTDLIREVPDFPKPGIGFKDIMPLLRHSRGIASVTNHLVSRYHDKQIDQIIGIESRGFIIGAPLASALKIPFNVIRKPGKLPSKVEKQEYALEYGSDAIEIQSDSINSGMKILIVDDVLATGGTARASYELVTNLGGIVLEFCFLAELGFLNGKDKLSTLKTKVFSLIKY